MANASPRSNSLMLSLNFALTIFVSAFLLFQVQPLISKFILPWFGGSPAVWTTCMLFFQSLLFGGYLYAHLSNKYLHPMRQGLVHMGLMVLAVLCALFFIPPGAYWKPTDSDSPVLRIMLLLGASVGFPYFVLSSTGPLLQAWFARAFPGRSPYRLYALSNIGSLLALLTYPFVVEPALDSYQQSHWWQAGFVLFCALCGYAAVHVRGEGKRATATVAPTKSAQDYSMALVVEAAPSWTRRAMWIVLPAFASLMLLATTHHVCQDVAPIPFLWVVPLGLYLLTFIIAFDAARWYIRPLFAIVGLVAVYMAAGMPAQLDDGKLFRVGKSMIEWYKNDLWPANQVAKAGLHNVAGYDAQAEQYLMLDEQQLPVWRTATTADTKSLKGLPQIDLEALPAIDAPNSVNSAVSQSLRLVEGQLRWVNLPEATSKRPADDLTVATGYDQYSNQVLMHKGPRLAWMSASQGWQAPTKYSFDLKTDFRHELFIHFTAMFCVCMICHGELVRLRPSPQYLTSFYLMISAGGALGGLFVSVVAPNIFTTHAEWSIALMGSTIIVAVALVMSTGIIDRARMLYRNHVGASSDGLLQNWLFRFVLLAVPLVCLSGLVFSEVVTFQKTDETDVIDRKRNFYGTVRIEGDDRKSKSLTGELEQQMAAEKDPTARALLKRDLYDRIVLYNGRIIHGLQFTDPGERRQATTYYTTDSGVGIAIGHFLRNKNLRIGAIGLGTGTLAAYCREPDHYMCFYEINPEVETLAKRFFTYIEDARGTVKIKLGDARLSLEQQAAAEGSQQYDVLVLDAFSGDAIPTHLLTKESFQIYLDHVNIDRGIIAIHISNRYLDLMPVVRGLAKEFDVQTLRVHADGEGRGGYSSEWVLLTNNAQFLKDNAQFNNPERNSPPSEFFFTGSDYADADRAKIAYEMILSWPKTILWTDAHSNLYEILIRKEDD